MAHKNPQFNVNDCIIVTGQPAYRYCSFDNSIAPVGSVGIIVSIRKRYPGTAFEYNQYKVHFDKYPDGDSLTHLYNQSDIELTKIKP